MDAARSTRKYPSYTTAELEAFIAEGVTKYRSAEKVAALAAEVAARKASTSIYNPTPQIDKAWWDCEPRTGAGSLD
jgi:hypothetical protein